LNRLHCLAGRQQGWRRKGQKENKKLKDEILSHLVKDQSGQAVVVAENLGSHNELARVELIELLCQQSLCARNHTFNS
jgi:hypothetical protein